MSLVKNEHELIRVEAKNPDVDTILKYGDEEFSGAEVACFYFEASELVITNMYDYHSAHPTRSFKLNLKECLPIEGYINAGYITGYLADPRGLNYLLDDLDAESGDALFSGYHAKSIVETCQDYMLDNNIIPVKQVIIIERVYIDPALRGLNLLNNAVQQLHHLLGRKSAVMVTMPVPVEMFYGDNPSIDQLVDDYDKDFIQAKQGLFRAFHRAFFHTYGGSSTMWRYFLDASQETINTYVRKEKTLNGKFCHICKKKSKKISR